MLAISHFGVHFAVAFFKGVTLPFKLRGELSLKFDIAF